MCIKRAKGAVTFEHVDFGYGDDLLIEDMNIDVHPGQTVAIVGPTGAGKTTLINLLMRFYELNGGTIKIDGLDTRDMSRNDLSEISEWFFKIHGSLMERLKTILLTEKRMQQMKKSFSEQYVMLLFLYW